VRAFVLCFSLTALLQLLVESSKTGEWLHGEVLKFAKNSRWIVLTCF